MIELIIQPVVDRVKDLIKDSGYLYFNIDEPKGIRQVNTLDISDSYNFLFCTPEQAKQLQLV